MTILDSREDPEGQDGDVGPMDLPDLPTVPGMMDLGPAKSPQKSIVPDLSPPEPSIAPPTSRHRPKAPAIIKAASPEGDDSDALRGRNFGGYELVQKIGQGGMGLVYKARQISLDRVVAIKILSKALSENSEFIKRFEREAKSIGRISHPNIVAVYDFGRHDGLYFMVNEFVEGTTLARVINDRMMVPTEEIVPYMVHCLSGMHHVAGHGIVHRDIKPDNILITKDGVAKIADFGLAKDVTNDTDLTAVGLAMGTPAYMSPEQCMGRKLDVRSDLYSLGVTAYFAFTGEKPFTGQSSFEIMTKQREHMPPPPIQLNPRVPKDASGLVMRMIAKNPHDRFKDANECREAWLKIGQEVGAVPSVSRSGEYHFSAAEMNNLRGAGNAPAVDPAMPPQLSPAPLPAPAMPSGLPSVSFQPQPAAVEAAPEPARSSTDRQSGTDKRPSTERRQARSSEATTCAKCGMLNRSDQRRCQRCDSPLAAGGEAEFAEDEHEAQRLLTAGQFQAAAKMFARLADQTEDRRIRTVMRSREREARMREQELQASDLIGRAQTMCARGDFKGGLEALERGLSAARGANHGGTEVEQALLAEIEAIRRGISRGRQTKFAALVLVVVCTLAAVGWWLITSGTLARMLGSRAPAAPQGESSPDAPAPPEVPSP